MKNYKEIANKYMAQHPDAWDEVKRATYAYRPTPPMVQIDHRNHGEPHSHYFLTSMRDAPCQWCGQTREGIRWNWYGATYRCEKRPKSVDQSTDVESIESIIAREEVLFEKVIERAKKIALKIDMSTLTGKELARIHHTYGVDPSMLECALIEIGLTLPQELHDEYQTAYNEHRKTGGRGFVYQKLVAKTQ